MSTRIAYFYFWSFVWSDSDMSRGLNLVTHRLLGQVEREMQDDPDDP